MHNDDSADSGPTYRHHTSHSYAFMTLCTPTPNKDNSSVQASTQRRDNWQTIMTFANTMPLHFFVKCALAFFSLNASIQLTNAFSLSTNRPLSSTGLRTSPRRSNTQLYNIFDAVGDILSGPKLEAEDALPYHPPFCDELSICNDGVRTFAIKERP